MSQDTQLSCLFIVHCCALSSLYWSKIGQRSRKEVLKLSSNIYWMMSSAAFSSTESVVHQFRKFHKKEPKEELEYFWLWKLWTRWTSETGNKCYTQLGELDCYREEIWLLKVEAHCTQNRAAEKKKKFSSHGRFFNISYQKRFTRALGTTLGPWAPVRWPANVAKTKILGVPWHQDNGEDLMLVNVIMK